MINSVRLKALVCDPVDDILIEGLKRRGVQVEYKPTITPSELSSSVNAYHIIVVRSRTKLSSEILSKASNLRIIARAGIGTDNIDTEYANRMGISVVTASGSSTHSVAELSVSLMIMLSRDLYSQINQTKNGIWEKSTGLELYGKTAGIIGLGRIGFATALILSSMGMRVFAYDPVVNQDAASRIPVNYVDMKELLSISDVLFIMAAFNGGGKNMITKDQLSMMRDGALIVNTSRAEFINGNDLLAALKNGKVRGYASDVFWHEPPAEQWEKEMLSLRNVIITPHIGAQTMEAQKKVAQYTLENILNMIREV